MMEPMSSSEAYSTNNSNTPLSSSSPPLTGDDKVLTDLGTLSDQMDLCRQMMVQQGGPPVDTSNEALLGVIGFLEACAPRMVELAGQSFEREETLMRCLEANDRLLRLLHALVHDDADAFRSTTADGRTAPPVASAAHHSNKDVDLNDLLDDDDDDVFDDGVLEPTPLFKTDQDDDHDANAKPAAVATKTEEDFDDFDAFLNERTSNAAPSDAKQHP